MERQTLADKQLKRKVLLTLVIPTRNEADNVPRLVRELKESLAGVDYRIVFVDDSADETHPSGLPYCTAMARRSPLLAINGVARGRATPRNRLVRKADTGIAAPAGR